MHYARVMSPIGEILLAASEAALVGAWFPGQKHFPPLENTDSIPLLPQGERAGSFPEPLYLAAEQLAEYFSGVRQTFSLPLRPMGTPFQQDIRQALMHIPYGETRTYSALAAAAGKPGAFRAAGAAVGRNPLGVIVPCHRVIGRDGSLTGYAGGLWRKEFLLRLEERNKGIKP